MLLLFVLANRWLLSATLEGVRRARGGRLALAAEDRAKNAVDMVDELVIEELRDARGRVECCKSHELALRAREFVKQQVIWSRGEPLTRLRSCWLMLDWPGR